MSRPMTATPTPTCSAYVGKLTATMWAPKEVTKPTKPRISAYHRCGRAAVAEASVSGVTTAPPQGAAGPGDTTRDHPADRSCDCLGGVLQGTCPSWRGN